MKYHLLAPIRWLAYAELNRYRPPGVASTRQIRSWWAGEIERDPWNSWRALRTLRS